MDPSDIINIYRTKASKRKNIEFEIRFKDISRDDFKRIFTEFVKNQTAEFTESIDLILGHKTTQINTIYFKDGIREREEQHSKKLLKFVKDYQRGFKISVAEENPSTKKISLNTDSGKVIVRFKRRASIQYGVWRADLTLTKMLRGIASADQIVKTRELIFPKGVKLTVDNFLDYGDVDKYEVEFEYLGDPNLLLVPIFAQLINDLFPIVNPNMSMTSKVVELAKNLSIILKQKRMLGMTTLKTVLPNVTILTWDTLLKQVYGNDEWLVTMKADGIRCVCDIDGGFIVFASSEEYKSQPYDDLDLKRTIFDGELIDNVYYAFDVIMADGNEVASLTFDKRLDIMKSTVEKIHKPNIRTKPFVKNIGEEIEKLVNEKQEYPTDGLVFVKCDSGFNTTTWVKWKPVEKITTDFLVRKAPKNTEFIAKPNTTTYYLFVTLVSSEPTRIPRCKGYAELFPEPFSTIFPIQFSHISNPNSYVYYHSNDSDVQDIDGKICEFAFIDGDWHLIKIRTDRNLDLNTKKYFGNALKTASSNYDSVLNPIPLDAIIHGSESYFAAEKSSIYRNQTQHISEVKEQGITARSDAEIIVDLGSGKGQDIFRYQRKTTKLKQLIEVDKDSAALEEASLRVRNSKNPIKFVVSFVNSDFTQPACYDAIKKVMQTEKVDVVISHISFHYCASSPTLIEQFVILCHKLLNDKGIVRIITPFGDKILSLLKDSHIEFGQSWKSYEHDVLKYEIKRGFEEDELTDAGQKISVLLPFSNGELYDEYLVNTDFVTKMFADRGFHLVSKHTLDTFETNASRKLTPDDKLYISLYGEMVFEKGEPKKVGKRVKLIPDKK